MIPKLTSEELLFDCIKNNIENRLHNTLRYKIYVVIFLYKKTKYSTQTISDTVAISNWDIRKIIVSYLRDLNDYERKCISEFGYQAKDPLEKIRNVVFW